MALSHRMSYRILLRRTVFHLQEVRSSGESEVLDNPVPDVLHQGTVDREGQTEGEAEDEGGPGSCHVSLTAGLSKDWSTSGPILI